MKETADIVNQLRKQLAAGNPAPVAARIVADQLPWRTLLQIARSWITSVALEIAPVVTVFKTSQERYPGKEVDSVHEEPKPDWGPDPN